MFIYHEGDMKQQIVGPIAFRGMGLTVEGMYLTSEVTCSVFALWSMFYSPVSVLYNLSHICLFAELEWMLGQAGAVDSTISEDPKPKVRDVLFQSLQSQKDECNDW